VQQKIESLKRNELLPVERENTCVA